MTIVEFLLARIAEDEAAARDVGADAMMGTHWRPLSEGAYNWTQGLVLNNCRRALAECAAKRAIVEEIHKCLDYGMEVWLDAPDLPDWIGFEPGYYDRDACSACGDLALPSPASRSFPCRTVRALAAVYADHPDYLPEWHG